MRELEQPWLVQAYKENLAIEEELGIASTCTDVNWYVWVGDSGRGCSGRVSAPPDLAWIQAAIAGVATDTQLPSLFLAVYLHGSGTLHDAPVCKSLH